MKKLIALTMAFITASTLAATTATLTLNGSISESVDISLDTTSTSAFDLTSSASSVLVATATETSNAANGFTVSISSAGAGNFVSTENSDYTVPYTMTYNGSSVDLSAGDTVVKSAAGPVTSTSEVRVSYTGVTGDAHISGAYQDTVTFEITAN